MNRYDFNYQVYCPKCGSNQYMKYGELYKYLMTNKLDYIDCIKCECEIGIKRLHGSSFNYYEPVIKN